MKQASPKMDSQAYLQDYFPAGAFTSEHQLSQLRTLAKRLRLASLPQIHGLMSGNHASRQKGRGLDLEMLRIYQPGDDIRTIDWRVTARTQNPHTRIYSEERERPVMVVCDQRSPMFFGSKRSFKSVVAAQCAALIAWAAHDHGDRVGAMILGNEQEWDFRPKQRAQHVFKILQALNHSNQALQQQSTPKLSLSESLKHLQQGLKPGTSVYLISDFYDLSEDDHATLFNLKRHNHVVALQVFDPLERQAPPPGIYGVTNGVKHGIIDTQNASTMNDYRQAVDIWQQGIERTFKQLAINHFSIDAADIPFAAIKLAIEQRSAK